MDSVNLFTLLSPKRFSLLSFSFFTVTYHAFCIFLFKIALCLLVCKSHPPCCRVASAATTDIAMYKATETAAAATASNVTLPGLTMERKFSIRKNVQVFPATINSKVNFRVRKVKAFDKSRANPAANVYTPVH